MALNGPELLVGRTGSYSVGGEGYAVAGEAGLFLCSTRLDGLDCTGKGGSNCSTVAMAAKMRGFPFIGIFPDLVLAERGNRDDEEGS